MDADAVIEAPRALREALLAGADGRAEVARVERLFATAGPTDVDAWIQALIAVTGEAIDDVAVVVGPIAAALADGAARSGMTDEVAPLLDALRSGFDPGTVAAALAGLPLAADARALRAAIATLHGDDRRAATALADALAVAEHDADLATATRLLRDLQAVWMRRGDWERVYGLAARLGRLAERLGGPADRVLATYEVALAAGRLGRHAEAARLASTALERAEVDVPSLVPRGELVLATVLAPADPRRAQELWHRMITAMPRRPGFEPLGARAALAMADALAQDPAATEARAELYRLAGQVGIDTGDPGLLAAARRGIDGLATARTGARA